MLIFIVTKLARASLGNILRHSRGWRPCTSTPGHTTLYRVRVHCTVSNGDDARPVQERLHCK